MFMDTKKIFIAIFAIIAVGWSFNIGEYITSNESTDDITYIDMVGPEGAYVMYYIDNVPIMLIHSNEIVDDNETIREVLLRYYFDKDYLKDDELASIINKTVSFNESRKNLYDDGVIHTYSPPEAYCLQISGLKFKDCYDKESCLLACASVPVCKYALEGIGDDEAFLEGMQQLKEDTDGMTESVEKIIAISNALRGISYSDYDENVSQNLTELMQEMKKLKSYKKSVENNFLLSDLLPSPGLQSFCPPVNYSTDLAEELEDLADLYDARLRNLMNVDDLADELAERTEERKQIKILLDTESEFGQKFSDLEERYDDLYSKYIRVSKVVNDTTLKSDINVLKSKKNVARDQIYSGNFSKADLVIRQFNVLADDFEEKIELYFNKTSKIELLQESSNKKIIMAEWDIEIDNIFLNQQLQDVKQRKNALDEKISGKLNPDEIDGVVEEYQRVLEEIDEIIQVKREHALDAALDKVITATNKYSNTLASAYVSATGGTYKQRKQVRDFVLPATLVMVDLVAISSFIAAFVYMIASGKIRLHKLAAMLWSFIFIAFFMTVAGGSIASYILINEKTNKASFGSFYSDVTASNEVAIIIDKRAGDVSEDCADSLKSTLEQGMNKTVRYYWFELDGCRKKYATGEEVSNEKISIDACDEEIESMPSIVMRISDSDSTKFSIKYTSVARIEGSNDYINLCQLDTILKEG